MNSNLRNRRIDDDKENVIALNRNNDIPELSPTTKSTIELLLRLKNGGGGIGNKKKRPHVALQENGAISLNQPLEVVSPLKPIYPLIKTTNFHFTDQPCHTIVISANQEIQTTSSLQAEPHSAVEIQRSNSIDLGSLQDSRRFHPRPPTSFAAFAPSKTEEGSEIRGAVSAMNAVNTTEAEAPPTLCNCRKSRCLKLYCECFKSRNYCSKECNCVNCANNTSHYDDRDEVIQLMLAKNPHAFDSHVDKKRGVNKSGCRCRKTHCDKKYCECYNSGVACGDQCQCINCNNRGKGSKSDSV